MASELGSCPKCRFELIEKTTYCPYCGVQLRTPAWKKTAAWMLLILIVWGLARCHIQLWNDFMRFAPEPQSEKPPSGILATSPGLEGETFGSQGVGVLDTRAKQAVQRLSATAPILHLLGAGTPAWNEQNVL